MVGKAPIPDSLPEFIGITGWYMEQNSGREGIKCQTKNMQPANIVDTLKCATFNIWKLPMMTDILFRKRVMCVKTA
jgi:hypothetical protein